MEKVMRRRRTRGLLSRVKLTVYIRHLARDRRGSVLVLASMLLVVAGMSLSAVFDLSGTLVEDRPATPPALFLKNGTYISQALDSRIYRCQWHRIVLNGTFPKGTRVRVSTFTAETELPGDLMLDPQVRWETNRDAARLDAGTFDCLVMNRGGRYLWLKLELRGDGQRAPEISSVAIEFPRISLRRYLPAVFGEEPSAADFTDRFLSIFDTTLRSIETTIDDQAQLFDPRSTPAVAVARGRATTSDPRTSTSTSSSFGSADSSGRTTTTVSAWPSPISRTMSSCSGVKGPARRFRPPRSSARTSRWMGVAGRRQAIANAPLAAGMPQ